MQSSMITGLSTGYAFLPGFYFLGGGLGSGKQNTKNSINLSLEQSVTLLKGQATLDSKSTVRSTKACYEFEVHVD